MRKLIYIVSVLLLVSCNGEHASDCFQTTGPIIREEVSVDVFDKILVNRNVELIIKEGPDQKVVIETGKNLLNDVEVIVVDGRLILSDHNNCNFVREYGTTKIYVTSPNIVEIRSSTQYDVSSEGVLTFPSLAILSENYIEPNTFTIGDFRLQIANTSFSVVFNNLSNCFVSGTTTNLNITFASGLSRFEGRNLVAQKVSVWNNSSNDMIVNPVQQIKGKISGTGDVICVNHPPAVNVEEQYKGRFIFEN